MFIEQSLASKRLKDVLSVLGALGSISDAIKELMLPPVKEDLTTE